jgi:hypothetical protein
MATQLKWLLCEVGMAMVEQDCAGWLEQIQNKGVLDLICRWR